MKSVATIAIAASIGVGTAAAQVCEETQFSSTNAQNYLNAETELIVNDNPQAALVALNALKAQDLTVYEEGAASVWARRLRSKPTILRARLGIF